MSFVIQPSERYLSAYRPVKVRAEITTTAAIEQALVTVYIDGIYTVQYRKTWILKTPAGGGQSTFRFEIDGQMVAQRALAPVTTAQSTIFGTLNAAYAQINGDCKKDLHFTLQYQFRNPVTNLLETDPTVYTSDTFKVICTTIQHTEDMKLDPFILDDAADTFRALTNAPVNQDICLGDNHYISFLSRLVNAVRITSYRDGIQIDQGYFKFFNDEVNGDGYFTTVGIGPENINNVSWDDGTVTLNETVDYYTVEIGIEIAPGAFGNALTNPFVFTIRKCCDDTKDLRIHWMNLLGGADAYTFSAVRIKTKKASAKRGEKPLTWTLHDNQDPNHLINDRGAFKINQISGKGYKLESRRVDDETQEWLQELFSSPEVYLETPLGFVPIDVADANNDYATSEDFQDIVKAVLSMANEEIVQRF